MRHNPITVCLLALVLCLRTPVYTSAAEVIADAADQEIIADLADQEVITDDAQKEETVEETVIEDSKDAAEETPDAPEQETEDAKGHEQEETVSDSEPSVEQTDGKEDGVTVIIEAEGITEAEQNTAKTATQKTGWVTIDGKTYYIKADGSKAKGVYEVNGIKFLFDPTTGELKKACWVVISGATYRSDRYGRMLTGWQLIGTRTYYLTDESYAEYKEADEGKRLSGYRYIGKHRYYLITSQMEGYKEADFASLARGWFTVNERKYYADPITGVLTTGFRTIDRKRYYFNEHGSLQLFYGWRTIGGKRYYFNSNHTIKRGLSKIGTSVYYLHSTTGAVLTGWRTINGKKYYFADEDYRSYNSSIQGKRLSGFSEIGGYIYYFITDEMSGYKEEDEASLAIGWKTINGNRYHFTIDGVRDKGWKTIGGYRYHFTIDGIMDDGWKTIGGKKYHFTDGKMDKGWKTISGKLYYFHSDGHRQECGRILLDGKTCAFDGNGICTSKDSSIRDVVNYASSWVGKIPYKSSVYGTDPSNERLLELKEGRGSDCSWFVFHCLEHYGYLSTHVNSYDWGSNPSKYPNAKTIGKDLSKAKAGDIICYAYGTPRTSRNSHVGIYIGNGKQIDCANGKGVSKSSVQTKSIINIVRFN